jgi:hypothetical protein
MKKTLLVIGFLIAGALVYTKAQPNLIDGNSKEAKDVSPNTGKAKPGTMDKYDEINGLVINRFRKEFPDASGALWAKTNTGFLVSFTSKGSSCHAYLSKHGILQGTIRYYGEKELVLDVHKRIQQNYPCLSITAVKEVSHGNTKAYFVTLEDTRTWKVIRIAGDEMDIWESHTKAVHSIVGL